MVVFLGAVPKLAAVSFVAASGDAFDPIVVVLEGVALCLVCVLLADGLVVDVLGAESAAGVAVSGVFFFTQDGCAGVAVGSAADLTHGGRNVVLFAELSLPLRFTFVMGILVEVWRHNGVQCEGEETDWYFVSKFQFVIPIAMITML